MSALPIIDSTHSHFINPARITLTIENVLNETAYEFVDFSLPNGDITLSLTCAHCDPLISLDETKIFLFLHSCIKEKVSIQYRISIINADGDKCHTQDGRFFGWNMKEKSCGELCQIESDYLFDPANGLLVDNKLTVYCEVEEIVGEHQMSCLFPHWNRISEDYQFILESGNMSDAVLVVGEKELRVHKLVLSTRSPVFAAMFAHPTTKESQENRVVIVDVDVEVMELLLKYIYTGKVETLETYAADLFVAADKYQLDQLQTLCERYLCSNITTESVCDLFLLADMHQVTKLYSKCIEYIIERNIEVMASQGWTRICLKPHLLAKLFQRLSIKHNEALVIIDDLSNQTF